MRVAVVVLLVLLVVGLSAGLYVVSRPPPPRPLAGQLFIVTRGGDNVKLGGVPVSLYELAATQASVSATAAAMAREAAALRDQVSAAQVAMVAAQDRAARLAAEDVAAGAAARDAAMRYNNGRSEARAQLTGRLRAAMTAATAAYVAAANRVATKEKAAMDAASAEHDRQQDAFDAQTVQERQAAATAAAAAAEQRQQALAAAVASGVAAEQAVDALGDKLADCLALRRVWSALPAPVQTVQTDADGRFSLTLPPAGDYVLGASAARRLLNKEESYFWLVRVVLPAPGQPLLLTNDTLVGAGSPLSLLPVAPAAAVPTSATP